MGAEASDRSWGSIGVQIGVLQKCWLCERKVVVDFRASGGMSKSVGKTGERMRSLDLISSWAVGDSGIRRDLTAARRVTSARLPMPLGFRTPSVPQSRSRQRCREQLSPSRCRSMRSSPPVPSPVSPSCCVCIRSMWSRRACSCRAKPNCLVRSDTMAWWMLFARSSSLKGKLHLLAPKSRSFMVLTVWFLGGM